MNNMELRLLHSIVDREIYNEVRDRGDIEWR